MGQEDYPTCVWCGKKVTHVDLERRSLFYLCTACGKVVEVEVQLDPDEGDD